MKHPHPLSFCLSFLLSLVFVGVATAAEPSARLWLDTETTADSVTTKVYMDTGGESVGGILIHLIASENLQFASGDFSASVFDQTVVDATAKEGNAVEFVRLRFDEGFDGSDGLLGSVTYDVVSGGDASIQISREISETIAYSDATNILATVEGAELTLAGGSDTPTHAAAPAAGISPVMLYGAGGAVLLVIVGGVFMLLGKKHKTAALSVADELQAPAAPEAPAEPAAPEPSDQTPDQPTV